VNGPAWLRLVELKYKFANQRASWNPRTITQSGKVPIVTATGQRKGVPQGLWMGSVFVQLQPPQPMRGSAGLWWHKA
jgi:hypothetical protein